MMHFRFFHNVCLCITCMCIYSIYIVYIAHRDAWGAIAMSHLTHDAMRVGWRTDSHSMMCCGAIFIVWCVGEGCAGDAHQLRGQPTRRRKSTHTYV
jgi:hypothetical protein